MLFPLTLNRPNLFWTRNKRIKKEINIWIVQQINALENGFMNNMRNRIKRLQFLKTSCV